jgi:hypothetical protein
MSLPLCQCGCGLPVKTEGSRFRRGHGQTLEARKAASERMKAHNPMHDPDAVARAVANRPKVNPKLSETQRRQYAEGTRTPSRAGTEARARSSARMKADNPMRQPDVVERVKRTRIDSGVNARIGERLRERWNQPGYRAAQVARMKANNPMRRVTVLEKSLSGPRLHQVASKMEKWFFELCESHQFPVWYSGLNSYWVQGRNPDFKVHGRKLVIEVTDTYTYRARSRTHDNYALPTIAHYEAHGHSCLVVTLPPRRQKWTADLQENLAEAIRVFLDTGASAAWSFTESSQ